MQTNSSILQSKIKSYIHIYDESAKAMGVSIRHDPIKALHHQSEWIW